VTGSKTCLHLSERLIVVLQLVIGIQYKGAMPACPQAGNDDAMKTNAGIIKNK
jgi:hypothetical protein